MAQPLTPVGSALAGALGACFSNAVVYPLDTVKTRIQALPAETETLPKSDQRPAIQGKAGRSPLDRLKKWKMLQMLIHIIKTEGLSGAFKGFAATMINTFSMQFAYFFFHSFLRTGALKAASKNSTAPKSLSTSSELALGAAAGALAQIFTIPVSVIATRQQLWQPDPSASTTKEIEPSLLQTAKQIVEESGWTGLWTGLKPGLVLTVNPAITYGVFERIKSSVLSGPRANDRLSVGENFWIGVGAKAIATVVTYPYIFAKVKLQAGTGRTPASEALRKPETSYADKASHPPSSSAAVPETEKPAQTPSAPTAPHRPAQPRGAIPLLAAIYAQHGIKGWYRGLSAQLFKAVLNQGILFVSKDQFELWTVLLISTLAAAKNRIAPK